MKWTEFWDMHSGGRQKEKWAKIYIEAPIHEAKLIFQNKFGHNPERVTCTCCGEDYSISESDTLEQATAFHRSCKYAYKNKRGEIVSEDEVWKCGIGLLKGYTSGYIEEPSKDCVKYPSIHKYQTINEFELRDDILIIREKDIKSEWRTGELKEQGYVWVD